MSLLGYYLMPHPPIIIPEVGNGEEKKIKNTSDAMETAAKEIAELKPDTIIIVSPHGTMFEDAIAIFGEDKMAGSLKKFGAPSIKMNIAVNKKLADKIYTMSTDQGIPAIVTTKELLGGYNASPELDHGAIVPLYFVNKFYDRYQIVHITYAALSDDDLYKFGLLIREAVDNLDTEAVFIASGDLSHRLKHDGPYGFNQYGPIFDREFLDNLSKGDSKAVFEMDPKTVFNAGECGRRSVSIMLGAIDGNDYSGKLLSYEGTFGVGYGVMKFEIISETDPYVKLAKESLTHYLKTGAMLEKIPSYVTPEMKSEKRGAFVSLKKNGDLRGCIGTIYPATESIADEIIRNSIEAGIYDPRFNEVKENELKDITFSVDVLTEPEPAEEKELDPKKYGVIVRRGTRTGLLLPDLEGVDTVEDQLAIAARKAGISPAEDYTIQKFRVIRHK